MSSRNLVLFSAFAVLLVPGGALADELDTLQFRASQSFQHDSNVFRLSDGADTQAILKTPNRSDTVSTTSVGLKLNKPYGLQRFELDASIEHSNYQRFSNLDFTAVNYAAAWRWNVTPALHGNLTADRKEYVDTSADVQISGQLNRRTNRLTALDAEYELDGVWRVLGGVFERTSTGSQASTFEGDSKLVGAEAGVRYAFPSGSSLAYRFKNGGGKYTNRASTTAVSSDFTDREHELKGEWGDGTRTKVQGRIAHFQRTHDSLPRRDFSGLIGQADATYALTGKTSVTAGVVRDLGSYQTGTASYYRGSRIFVAPTWKPTVLTAVRFRYDFGVRDFRGPLPGFAASNRRDKISLASLALEWQALRALKLTAWIQRDVRKSNEPNADYKSNAIGISAQASF